MINSMLEGDVPASIVSKILGILDFAQIRRLIAIYYEKQQGNRSALSLKDPNDDPFVKVSVDYYVMVRTLISRYHSSGCTAPYPPEFVNLLNCRAFLKLEERFGHMVGAVEILRDERLQVVLFRIPPLVIEQSEAPGFRESKDEMVFSVRRDSQQSKLDDFIKSSDGLIADLIAYPRLKGTIFVRKSTQIALVTWALAIVLNILALVVSDDRDAEGPGEAMYLFGVLQAIFSIARLLSYTATTAPKYIYNKVQELQHELGVLNQESYDKGGHSDATAGGEPAGGLTFDDETEPLNKYEEVLTEEKATIKSIRELQTPWRMAYYVLMFLIAPVTLYEWLYVACAFVGLAWKPVFYSFMLLDIVKRSSLLRQVFQALAKYAGALGAAALLWFTLMYIFGSIGYAFFESSFIVDGDVRCESKISCVMLTFTAAMRSGGGIADVMKDTEYDVDPYWGRAFFDTLYFIHQLVMIAIVTGIIIDAFGDSRDHRQEVEEDQENQCFICGIERSRFDKRKGFDWHVKNEHHMWNYIYFLAALRQKDPTEYTGQESYVAELANEGQTDFFPIDRALMLEEKKEE
jgi:hypothetical protein